MQQEGQTVNTTKHQYDASGGVKVQLAAQRAEELEKKLEEMQKKKNQTPS